MRPPISKYKLLFATALIGLSYLGAAQTPGTQLARVSPWGTKFWLYTPPNYVASTPTPLLLYLHGGGSIGNDLSILTNPTSSDKAPPSLIANGGWVTTRPFIVVSPQLRRNNNIPNYNDQEWDPDSVNEVLNYVKTLLNVDNNRLYLTGMSLGGAACWTYAEKYPANVAAIVPISGKTDITKACLVKDIGIWAFHGANDNLVDPPYSINMVNAVKACNGAYIPKLNLLIARQHEGWNEVWNGTYGYPVFDWMLQFTKASSTNKAPFVTAGSDMRLLQRSGTIHIYGEYFDFDGTISSVQWVQTSGTSLILANATTNFLELNNVPVGTYTFELRVIDNQGGQSTDQVSLTILGSVGTEAAVTGLTLLNGATGAVIASLSEGYVLNKTTLGVTQFNLRAETNAATVSVCFRVNADQNARISGTAPYLIRKQISSAEWVIDNGDYVVCVTPFKMNAAKGAPGISQCYKITVTDQVVVVSTFYSKPNSDVSVLSSWGASADGSGSPPLSFSTANQDFIVLNSCTIGNPLTVGGDGSEITVKGTGTLNVNSAYTGLLNAETTAIVNINTSQPINFGNISSNTQFNFGAAATQIPFAEYGNIRLMGAGTTKTLASDSTFIINNFTIDAGVIVNGASNNSSVICPASDFNIDETGSFSPVVPFSIFLKSQTGQNLNFKCNNASFNSIELYANNPVQLINTNGTTSLEVGTATGGGLKINNGAHFSLGKNKLSVTGKGTLNPGGESGELGFSKTGSLQIVSQSPNDFHLYVMSQFDSISTVDLNASGAGTLHIHNRVYIYDSVKLYNGTLHSNGNLSFISMPSHAARLARIEGTGILDGAVEYQRHIEKERLYKYLSFPVQGNKISNLQSYIPVTGNFAGASTGPGLSNNPSMYIYQEPTGWIVYPTVDNTAPLTPGSGYSVYLRNNLTDTKLLMTGNVEQKDFPFSITADPDTSNADDGWNLLGNPYISPIRWGTAGWASTGINSTTYIRDNSLGGGRFFVWDGSVGDPEFNGIIPPGQSFWVRSTSSNPTLVISETAKESGNSVLFRKKTEEIKYLSVELTQGNLVDRAYIRKREEADNMFEPLHDALKQDNAYFSISTLSKDHKRLAINNVPMTMCRDTISVHVNNITKGNYVLSFKGTVIADPNLTFRVHDRFTNEVVSINTPYQFTVDDDTLSSSPSRFLIYVGTTDPLPEIQEVNNSLHSNYAEGNQWLRDGQIIGGATNQDYKPTTSGTYQVEVTRGCLDVSSPVTFVITSTGPELGQLYLYPNPVHGNKIKLLVNEQEEMQFNIINAQGQIVQSGRQTPLNQALTIDLLDNIVQGYYILMLQWLGTSRRFTFIKQY